MLKSAGLAAVVGLLLVPNNVDATATQRGRRRSLQKGNKVPSKYSPKKNVDIPKHCLYIENEVLWTELFYDEYYEDDWWDPCRDYFLSIMPSESPTISRSPNVIPTGTPTKKPIASPSSKPSSKPTSVPTKSPTSSPSKTPTAKPTTSSSPTSSRVAVVLPEVQLQLQYGEVRRLMLGRDLVEIDSMAAKALFTNIITIAFQKYSGFLKVNLYDKPYLSSTDSKGVTTFMFPISGEADFESTADITSQTYDMKETMKNALAKGNYESLTQTKLTGTFVLGLETSPDATIIVDGNKKNTGGTVTITVVACVVAVVSTLTALGLIFSYKRKNNEEMETLSPSNKEDVGPKTPSGLRLRSAFPISTIGTGNGKFFLKLDDESLASKSQTTENGKYIIHPDISCVDSSFSRDEESSLEAPSLAGLSSICDYSKIDDYSKLGTMSVDEYSKVGTMSVDDYSKLGAMSVDEYSKIGTISVDEYSKEDSLTNMSALDEVRLGKVLDLEGSVLEENSLTNTAERDENRKKKSAFAKLWYGSRRRSKNTSENVESDISCADDSLMPQESCDDSMTASIASAVVGTKYEITKLAPPKKDSPFKNNVAENAADDVIPKVLNFKDDSSSMSDSQVDPEESKDQHENLSVTEEASNIYLLGSRSDSSVDADSMDFYGAPHDAEESSGIEDSSVGESSGLSSNME